MARVVSAAGERMRNVEHGAEKDAPCIDHEKCCKYLLCAHPECCGYYGRTLRTRVTPPTGATR